MDDGHGGKKRAASNSISKRREKLRLSLLALLRDGSLVAVAVTVGVEIPHAVWRVGLNPFHGLDMSIHEEEVCHSVMDAHIRAAPLAQVRTAPVALNDDDFLRWSHHYGEFRGGIVRIRKPSGG